jgi:hypothetical protein
MSFEDLLRAKLHSAAGAMPGRPLDTAAVLERGRRARRSYVLTLAAASVVVLAALAAGSLQLARALDNRSQPAGPGPKPGDVTPTPAPSDEGVDSSRERGLDALERFVQAIHDEKARAAWEVVGPTTRSNWLPFDHPLSYFRKELRGDRWREGVGVLADTAEYRLIPIASSGEAVRYAGVVTATVHGTPAVYSAPVTVLANGDAFVDFLAGGSAFIELRGVAGPPGPQDLGTIFTLPTNPTGHPSFAALVAGDTVEAGFSIVGETHGFNRARLSPDGNRGKLARWSPRAPLPSGTHVLVAYMVDRRGAVALTATGFTVRP